MGQRAPTAGQIAVAVAFAFSCFGLLLFLWTTFGGPVPLKPEGYRIKVPFSEATQLAQESDVRIHNVSVGKVKTITLENSGPNKDLAVATIEIDSRYAPLPADTRAMLRQKTLLGETYVELTQGDGSGPKLAEGATLPRAQVQPSVQLDEIFRTFDAKTRAAFQTWMQQLAIASAGRGADLNAAIANLPVFAEDANKVLRVLDTQQGAVQQFVRDTGEVFGALSERQGQLQSLIRNSGIVFHTTAVRNQDLEATFRALPTFLDESRLTLNRLDSFSRNANPLITQLHPSARLLSANLKQVAKVAPSFNSFFIGLRKVEKRGQTGPPGAPEAARHGPAAPAARGHPVLQADHPARPDRRPLPERRHRVPGQRRLLAERHGDDRDRRQHPLHPQLGAAVSGCPRHLHLAPARLLAGEPVSRPQQRPQGGQRARHLRHDGVLRRGRAGGAAQSTRQLLHE